MSDTYEEVIAERDGYRAKIVVDYDATEPYNDGGSPLLRITGYGHAEQVTGITSYELPFEITAAFSRFEDDVFERYLRIFHGTTSIVWWDQQQYNADRFVTFDTTHWREAMGIDDAQLATITAAGRNIADLDEWKWYCEGDVYGIVIEKRSATPANRAALDAAAAELGADALYTAVAAKADEDNDDVDWVEIDSMWGYYGDKYATESAREKLNEYAPKPDWQEGPA